MRRPPFHAAFASVALVVAIALLACRQPPDADAEALAIVRAYESIGGAPLGDRAIAIDSFRAAQCKRPENCADRDACATYASALLRTQTLADKARTLGPSDAGGNGAAKATELALIVDGADRALKAADSAAPACAKALRALYARARPGAP